MSNKPWTGRAAKLAFLCLACLQVLSAQLFEKSDVMIPMRDGVKLHTVIFAPKERTGPLPIMFVRSPYGTPPDETAIIASLEFLVDDGYVFAFQDIRGRLKSEGEFIALCREISSYRVL
jgi:uncharacterized protein